MEDIEKIQEENLDEIKILHQYMELNELKKNNSSRIFNTIRGFHSQ